MAESAHSADEQASTKPISPTVPNIRRTRTRTEDLAVANPQVPLSIVFGRLFHEFVCLNMSGRPVSSDTAVRSPQKRLKLCVPMSPQKRLKLIVSVYPSMAIVILIMMFDFIQNSPFTPS